VETLRKVVRRLNWKISEESSKSSGGSRVVRMAVDCDSAGNISIYDESVVGSSPLGTPTGGDALKYLTFSVNTLAGGAAELRDDETKSRSNQTATFTASGHARSGPEGDGWETHVSMHELFHLFGGVQLEAPFQGGSQVHHCEDNWDMLCYSSAFFPCPESEGYLTPTKLPIDCRKDTYFNAAPAGGSYLATHWNIAGPENPFLTILPSKAPKTSTKAAASVKAGSAALEGTVTPESEYAYFEFQYGLTTSYGSTTGRHGVVGNGSTAANVQFTVSDLVPNTTYHYRVVASNDLGQTVTGEDKSFTTAPEPVVIAKDATEIGVSDATKGKASINAVINGGKTNTTYQFQWVQFKSGGYGPYDHTLPATPKSIGSEGKYVEVSELMTGLEDNSSYKFRVCATNSFGTTCGGERTFDTEDWTPKAATQDVTTHPNNAAAVSLNGSVLTGVDLGEGNLSTSYKFRYWSEKTNEFGESILSGVAPVPDGVVSGPGGGGNAVSETLGGLVAGETYFFRLEVANVEGSHVGTTKSFVAPLVAAYSFDEGTGTTLNDASGNHDGTLEGGPTWSASGKYGGALEFDGSNDLVKIANANDLDLTKAFTIEAWVRPDNATATRPVVSKTESGGSGLAGYLLNLDESTAKARGWVLNSGTFKSVAGTSATPAGSWTHIAYTFDNLETSHSIYVNGQLEATKYEVPITAGATAANLEIGHSAYFNTYFDGKIDDVRIYNAVLSEAQIKADRDTPVAPVAAYSFNQLTGTTLTDVAGNHDGTLEGGPAWRFSGKYGRALEFDGTNDLVKIADANDLDLTGAFTLEAWVRPDTLTAGTVIQKAQSSSESIWGYWLNAGRTATEGKPSTTVGKPGTLIEAIGTSATPTGAWTHLAATSDGSTLRLYVNGSQVASTAAVPVAETNGQLKIGSGITGWFDGTIDELRIYNVALSQARIEVDRNSAL
jgi:hypothetical protein